MCNSNKCAICECTSSEIPVFWKEQQQTSQLDMFDHSLKSISKDCPQNANEWCHEEEFDSNSIYVNLAKNRESYTAYEGMQVWKAIYQENCLIEKIKDVDFTNTCTEETLLYQLVSGLHTSINMHVASNYKETANGKLEANYEMFLKNHGQQPDRLKNLFFLYAVILRAINRAEPILKSYDFETQIDAKLD